MTSCLNPKIMSEKSHQIDNFYKTLQNQGQHLDILDEASTRKNPFPGLRPFQIRESHLFFGREDQSIAMIQKLMTSRFLCVLGASGSGKSSLVRAGMIPALHAGFGQSENYRWKIILLRPGADPIRNLAAQINLADCKENLEQEISETQSILNESSYGLADLATDKQYDKTLVVVDQFEELFRFKERIEPPRARARFVNLLLKASAELSANCYIVLTMRSEFIGDCVEFRGLPEKLNEGQYLTPRLSEKSIRAAITGPIRVAGAAINPTLVNRLAREVYYDQDQLPVLQHALMRTYWQWRKEDKTDKPIDHEHYDKVGQMKTALSQHADQKLSELDDPQQIARTIFLRLTDTVSDNQGGRMPTSLREIAKIANTKVETARKVADHFRTADAPFLTPNCEIQPELAPESILDISHESLIRQWGTLKKWIEEEKTNIEQYRRLNRRRKDGDPIKGDLLKELTDWKKKRSVNEYWAARYHEAEDLKQRADKDAPLTPEENKQIFEQNFDFLSKSKFKKRIRLMLIFGGMTAILLAAVFAIFSANTAAEQRGLAIAAEGLAKKAEYKAIMARDSLSAEKTRSDSLRQVAESANAQLLKIEEESVKKLLKDAEAYIKDLKYTEALKSYEVAAGLKLMKTEVAKGLLEIAYVYTEINHVDKAHELQDTAANLLGVAPLKYTKSDQIQERRKALRERARRLDSNLFAKLQKKYYPDIASIRQNDTTDLQIARAETSLWQYYLFCKSKGREISDYTTQKTLKLPGAEKDVPIPRIQGDLPAVNINYNEAKAYIHWLNDRQISQKDSFRLPSAAEWRDLVGSNSIELAGIVRAIGNGKLKTSQKLLSVDKLRPEDRGISTESGFHDLIGNVWEWAESEKNTNAEVAMFGGSWKNNSEDFKEMANQKFEIKKDRSLKWESAGFRVALEKK